MNDISWPDGMDAQAFLDGFWQQRSLLIQQAFPNFETPVAPDDLAGLAIDQETTPRLILHTGGNQYLVENGPFDESRFDTLTGNDWSLLVTDVEKHLPELREYLAPFAFLPSWRIDDLMISYAPVGASVGAHVDDYDVFLLQASGTRRWSIDTSDKPDLSLEAGGDLQLLSNFKPNETHDLEPGDMLYLPPGVPHHGVAISDNCTTWSIGFRAPAQTDIVSEFCDQLLEQLGNARFTDGKLSSAAVSGEISSSSIERFGKLWSDATRLTDAQVASFTGKLLSRAPDIDVERYDEDTLFDAAARWSTHPFSRFAFVVSDGVVASDNDLVADNGIAVNSGATTDNSTGQVRLYVDGIEYRCSRIFAEKLCTSQSAPDVSAKAPAQAINASELNDGDQQVLEELVEAGCMQRLD